MAVSGHNPMLFGGASSRFEVGHNVEQFHRLVTEAFCPLSCETATDAAFSGGVYSQRLGDVGFAAVRSAPLEVYRRREHISRFPDASYLVKVQVEGESIVRHRGREAHLRPGDFTLCLNSEPYELHFPIDYLQVVLAVPEKLMEQSLLQPTDHLGLRMDSRVGANGLFTQFVTALASQVDSMDGTLARRLEANVIDLLVTSLAHARDVQRRDQHQCGVRREYLHRIRTFIRRHLDDERLGPDWIAESHRISTRYLHMLFETEGVSVSRHIQQLRLEACRGALRDAAFSEFSVAEIAYRFGFKDASHFSRAFKAEFAVTPARFRRDPGTTGLPDSG